MYIIGWITNELQIHCRSYGCGWLLLALVLNLSQHLLRRKSPILERGFNPPPKRPAQVRLGSDSLWTQPYDGTVAAEHSWHLHRWRRDISNWWLMKSSMTDCARFPRSLVSEWMFQGSLCPKVFSEFGFKPDFLATVTCNLTVPRISTRSHCQPRASRESRYPGDGQAEAGRSCLDTPRRSFALCHTV